MPVSTANSRWGAGRERYGRPMPDERYAIRGERAVEATGEAWTRRP